MHSQRTLSMITAQRDFIMSGHDGFLHKLPNNGVLPRRFRGEWVTKRIGTICDVDPENLSSATHPDFQFNYISLEQVDTGRLLGFSEERFVTAPTRARRVLKYGDILMSTVRPNLMAHLLFTGQIRDAVCSTGFSVIRCRKDSCDPRYLFAHLFGKTVNNQIDSIITGSNYPAINSHDIRLIEVPFPPTVEEQSVIAEALADVDGLLAALASLVVKKQVIKHSTIQQLLNGSIHVLGFSDKRQTKRLGDFCSIRNCKVKPSDLPSDTLCVELDDVETGSGTLRSFSTARNATSAKYLFHVGDVLFGRLRPYLRKYWLADRTGICTTEIWPLIVDSTQADRGFLYAIVQSNEFYRAAGVSYGTHMPRADWYVMRNLEVSLPPIAEQRIIASIVYDMETEITTIENLGVKIRAIREWMMQQLLTGRTRLARPNLTSKGDQLP